MTGLSHGVDLGSYRAEIDRLTARAEAAEAKVNAGLAIIDAPIGTMAEQALVVPAVKLSRIRRALTDPPKAEPEPPDCRCEPCPGRGNDGHGMTHCAECCFGTGVVADIDCPIHGDPAKAEPETGEQP